ncbi:MAG: hypothetical protein M1831_004459 [Alyxoria varia]|nr:MAG: hypothetical protein M1831_004459 [Alyxoria varia]
MEIIEGTKAVNEHEEEDEEADDEAEQAIHWPSTHVFISQSLVENPFRLNMKELIEQFESLTYPITLVCAGNRRKEQNVVRKTKGFSWGPAGVSTALFTGIAMSDIIRRARPRRRGKYVCMEGADKLPNGHYGTSLKMNWVMDANRGIMVAYKMNGEPLKPDHGKPLRAVVPGQIGGRSVKWLTKLIANVSTLVSPEESANNQNWWKDERYAIFELNCNSAIVYPAHEEQLCLKGAADKYRVKGYAYGGGGRRITRVEISIDRGKTWQLARIEYPEDIYRDAREDAQLYGGRLDMSWREACFCWCFWNLDVAVDDLRLANDILVRSMDEAMQVQPRDMYWSVLGMMNNPWFRVTISQEGDYLRFEHPTQPALLSGGWMERVKKAGGNLTNGYWGERLGDEDSEVPPSEQAAETVKMTKDSLEHLVTIDQLRKHDNAETGPWFVVNGEVYDGTEFLQEHPGGAQSIISAAGMDSTDEFMAIHSETAKAMMPGYHIGTLDENARNVLGEGDVQENDAGSTPRSQFLDPRSWRKAILLSKLTVSWDTRLFKFKLEHEDQRLGLPTGQHLMMRLRDPVTREAIIRSYTPISEEERERGHLDVLVKVYFDTKERKGGKMSQAMEALPLGHFVEFKGPIGKFNYLGFGTCAVNSRQRQIKTFVMISGGSGVTPIFQVFRAVMQNPKDKTRCILINGNRCVEDILCKDELATLASGNEHRCELLHTLTQPQEDWTGLRGRIGSSLLQERAPRQKDQMALICGPEAMEKSVHKILTDQGWDDDDLLFF